MTVREAPPGRPEETPTAGSLGMRVFLFSLTMLFGASLVGYAVIRLRAPAWPPPGMPGIPWVLALSTALIVVSSFAAQRAWRLAREQKQDALHRALVTTLTLGLLFVALQAVAWWQMFPAVEAIGLRPRHAGPPAGDPAPRQFAFLFYTLTVLHALHVLGGLVAFALLLNRRLSYRSPLRMLARVHHAVVYWHFVDGVWLVLYVALLL